MDRFAQAFWAALEPYAGMFAVFAAFLLFAGGFALLDRIERK